MPSKAFFQKTERIFHCELPEILQLNPAYIHSSAFRIKSMISSNERSLSTYASYNACFALSIFRSGCRSSSSMESSSARTLYSLRKTYRTTKRVFLICTYGGSANYKSIEQILDKKHSTVIGKFGCKGYDTFGPFKLVGGIAKGHPDEKDIKNAVEFVKGL